MNSSRLCSTFHIGAYVGVFSCRSERRELAPADVDVVAGPRRSGQLGDLVGRHAGAEREAEQRRS
jgi:hypothetical protein